MATSITIDSEDGRPAAEKPRIWSCNWNWCPKTFRQSSDLANHLQELHFNNIVAVKKRYWNDYLRSVDGQSGATDSLMADIPSHSNSEPSNLDISASQVSPTDPDGTQQRFPPPSTPLPKPQIPRNLLRARSDSQQSPAISQPAAGASTHSPTSPFAIPASTSPQVRVHEPSSPAASSSSDSDTRSAKRRRTKSFAGYTAQSSPMSTPSVSSMPPSPPLSNMITDAINASARINAGTLSPSPSKFATVRTPGGSGSGRAVPIPRRTNLSGASPTADAPRSLVDALNEHGATSPTPRFGATSAFRAQTSIRSSASVQAVEDALTQGLGPSAPTSPARSQPRSQGRSQPHSGVENLQYPSQSASSQSQLRSERTMQSSSPSVEHGVYHGSHAVESEPRSQAYSPESLSARRTHPVASQSTLAPPSSSPAKTQIPRTRRAQSQSQTQSQVQSEAKPRSSAARPPIPRTLRSRSKTPGAAAATVNPYVELMEALVKAHDPKSQQSRTTRSRASSASTANYPPHAPARGKRAGSKPPSTGPVRRSSRARSKPPSAGTAQSAGTAHAQQRGLPVVDEQSDDEGAPPPPPQQSQSHSQSPSQFRSGTLYVPIPRRTRAGSHAQSQSQSQMQFEPLPRGPVPMKRDPDAEAGPSGSAMDVDAPSHSRSQTPAGRAERGNSGGTQGQDASSQESGRGYVEGYGFDMGSLVLQTQAPYKWSQSP